MVDGLSEIAADSSFSLQRGNILRARYGQAQAAANDVERNGTSKALGPR